MTKDQKVRVISYIILTFATIFGLLFTLYVTLSGEFPYMETERGTLLAIGFISIALVNFGQGTIAIIRVFKQ